MPSKTLPPKPRSIAAKKTISIVASLYNEDLVNSLLDSTVNGLRTLIPGITVNIYRVPGAFEIPVCAKKLIESNNIDVMIALGVIIKGETSHFDFLCSSVFYSITSLSVNYKKPIGNGILTCDTKKQASKRANPKEGDKGGDAAKAIISLLNILN